MTVDKAQRGESSVTTASGVTEPDPDADAAAQAQDSPDSSGPDAWLDRVADEGATRDQRLSRWRAVVEDAVAGPLMRLRRIFNFLVTTPGKMAGITVLLSVAIFAAGYSMSQSSAERQEGLDVLLSEAEPLSFAAHDLYTNLSAADTVATNGFVGAGMDSRAALEEYFTAIDQASVAATQSATGITPETPRIGELITTIQRELPIYTAMVETARTNTRAGNPLGVTYMSNASSLMRTSLLPAADELFRLTSDEVARQQQQLTTPQWVPLSGLFAAVFFLVLAQWWLWRTTRRRFNRGFLVATVMMVAAILWVSASNYATWQAGGRGFQEASQPWDSMTTARIQAQQAQTAETLSLLQREAALDANGDFEQMAESVSTALTEMESAIDTRREANDDVELDRLPSVNRADLSMESAGELIGEARSALLDWSDAHERFAEALASGDFDAAADQTTTIAVAPGQLPTTASSAARLDDALSTLIYDARITMRAFIAEGLAATALVATAVLLLAFGSVLSIWLGIRSRLQEYL